MQAERNHARGVDRARPDPDRTGIAIWFGRINYPTEHDVVKVGDLSATLTRERPVPQWLGGVTALTGLIIAALGTRYRR